MPTIMRLHRVTIVVKLTRQMHVFINVDKVNIGYLHFYNF